MRLTAVAANTVASISGRAGGALTGALAEHKK
jgi:hypothetical protein